MELTYYGANCFKLTSKNTSLVIDDNLEALGLKSILSSEDALLSTQKFLANEDVTDARIVIDGPGEYELDSVAVLGIQARAYTDTDDKKTATIYKIMNGEHQILFLGHVHAKLESKVLEKIGVVDVLVLPIGGSGYTLDAEDAAEVVKLLSPKITIPCHYQDDAVAYDMPMRGLDEFYAKMGIAATDAFKSLKLKGDLEEAVVTLERQK